VIWWRDGRDFDGRKNRPIQHIFKHIFKVLHNLIESVDVECDKSYDIYNISQRFRFGLRFFF
jgi:hypothetical protein